MWFPQKADISIDIQPNCNSDYIQTQTIYKHIGIKITHLRSIKESMLLQLNTGKETINPHTCKQNLHSVANSRQAQTIRLKPTQLVATSPNCTQIHVTFTHKMWDHIMNEKT